MRSSIRRCSASFFSNNQKFNRVRFLRMRVFFHRGTASSSSRNSSIESAMLVLPAPDGTPPRLFRSRSVHDGDTSEKWRQEGDTRRSTATSLRFVVPPVRRIRSNAFNSDCIPPAKNEEQQRAADAIRALLPRPESSEQQLKSSLIDSIISSKCRYQSSNRLVDALVQIRTITIHDSFKSANESD